MLTLDNPVFQAFAIASAIMIIKILGQGLMTVQRMIKINGGMLNPEDLNRTIANPNPHKDQLKINDYVERSRRMHRNDLENIPAFLAAGLLFVIVEPALVLAQIVFYGFVAARLLHFWAYLSAKPHEWRAAFYSVGVLLTMFMSAYVLVVAVS